MTGVAIHVPSEEQLDSEKPTWLLKNLKPQHRQICSMIVQGIPRYTIAEVMHCTPEYISILIRQPIIQEEVKRFSEFAGIQLESQFTKVVDAIGNTLENGNHKEQMMAARLQLEVTKRIGPRSEDKGNAGSMEDKLVNLADRLVGLLENKMATNEVKQDEDVQDAEFSSRTTAEISSDERPHEST